MKLFVLILFLILFSPLGMANECTSLLGDTGEVNEEFQDQLESYVVKVETLSEAYNQHLGMFHNPFGLIYTENDGKLMYERLLRRRYQDKWIYSPMARTNMALREYHLDKTFQTELVEWVLADSEYLLKVEEAHKRGDEQVNPYEREDYQANLLALTYLKTYLLRYMDPSRFPEVEGEPSDQEGEGQQEEENGEEEEGENQDEGKGGDDDPPPAEYPELPEDYEPHTNDTSKSGGDGEPEKKEIVAEVNFKTAFFAQRYFNEIVRGIDKPFRGGDLSMTLNPPSRSKETGFELKINPLGETTVSLFVPPLYKPLQPSDPRATISRTKSGGYILKTDAVLNEVRIPLIKDPGFTMMPHVEEILTRPVGFDKSEWPDEVRLDVFAKFPEEKKHDPLKVAQAIADHIATKYLYSVGPKPEKDPIEAMKRGAFQCDMAFYVMVGLLRDVYKIPSRVVEGYRGREYKKLNDGKSYLVLPGEPHGWVEVYHAGRWHVFDPTPVNKDAKDSDDEGGAADEYSDIPLENTPKADPEEPETGEQQEGQSGGESQEGEQGASREDNQSSGGGGDAEENEKSHQERLEENTSERTNAIKKDSEEKEGGQASQDEQSDSEEKGSGSEGNEREDQEKEQSQQDGEGDDENPLLADDLEDLLEIGSLQLDPSENRNPLLERATRLLLKMAVEPNQKGAMSLEKLNRMGSTLKRYNSPALKSLFQEALSLHSKDHPVLDDWVAQIGSLLSKRNLNTSYQELTRVGKAIEVYSRLLDREGQVRAPVELLQKIRKIKTEIAKLDHPDSNNIAIVNDLYRDLPSVARRLLNLDYDLQQVGPNPPTQAVARDLRSGDLKDLRLVSILSPLTDFILNSTPRPENIEVKTWLRDASKLRGRDLVPVRRMSELPKAILGDRSKSAIENMRQGTAYIQAHRKRVLVPAGRGQDEAERITILLLDVSPSMRGEPERFQAGLASAFTSNALSDLTKSGRHRHRVLILPFSTRVHMDRIERVNTAVDAIGVLRNYRARLEADGDGTDIQEALEQAMALIADAEKRSGEPLAAASIILMTDGQASIDAKRLAELRKSIDRTTPLQTMFIAIGDTNPDLIEYAMNSRAMGMEKGFYREFTDDHISDILREADSTDFTQVEEGSFYTQRTAADLPISVSRDLQESRRLAARFITEVEKDAKFKSARDHLKEFETVAWSDVGESGRPSENWLNKLRRFSQTPSFEDKKVLQRVVDDLMVNLETLMGLSREQFSGYEQEQLRHLLRYAAGLQDTP